MANAPDPARTTVFVSDLSRQIDRTQIRQIFSPYGEIIDFHVPDPVRPGQNLKAVITYRTHEQAQSVIRECNYMKVNGIPIHVTWRETDHQRDTGAKLVITNLPPSVEEGELHDALQEYGEVDSVRITRRPTGESTGIAYVQFERVEGARAAHEALQGASIKGHDIKVDYFRLPSDRQELTRKLPPGFLAVEPPFGAELPPRDSLFTLFSQFGEILDIFDVPEHAVVSFARPESASAAAALADDRITILPGLRWSLQIRLLEEVERRRVYVCDLTEEGRASLPALLATAGRVVQLSFSSRSADVSAIVQYESAAARRAALDTLDGRTPEGQATPIRVVPFLDKRLEHPRGGLLQLNELEPCAPAELRARFAAFGAVSAVSVAPASGFVVGFVLFEQFGDAQKAHEAAVVPNSFLYPPIDEAHLCDLASSFCDKLRGRWLAVPDLGRGGARQAVVTAVGPKADSAWFAANGTAYVNFKERADLVAGAQRLKDSGRRFDLLSSYMLLRGGQLLASPPRGFGSGRLLFVSGLPRETGNRELRETFERFGAVEAAMVSVHIDTGMPIGKAIVLFAEQAHATEAKQTPILAGEFGAPLIVSDFRGKVERSAAPPPEQPAPEPQHVVIPRARDVLRELIRGRPGLGAEQIARLLERVGSLSLDDVYTFLTYPGRLDEWVARIQA